MYYFFFFSSRRRHTRFKCDWSSDVCSSDLGQAFETFANGESPLKLMSRYQTDCRWQYDRAFRSLNALRESQPDEPSRPVIGPDTVVKFYYCAHTGDKCTDENRLADCPRQEPCPVLAIGEGPTLPVSPTEPNPKNEHPIETAPDKPPPAHESPTEPHPTNNHRTTTLPPTNYHAQP